MHKKIGIFCWRTGIFSLRLSGVFVIALCILSGLFIWNVHTAPIDIAFAKEYIQDALYDEETGNHVTMDSVVLYWPDLKGPLYLQMQGTTLFSSKNIPLFSVDEVAISFSRSAFLLGRILPKSIILKKPVLKIARTQDNHFDLGFGNIKTTEAQTQSDEEAIATRIFAYIARPGHESTKRSIISRLEALEIENASLIMEDHNLGISWFLSDFKAGFFSTDHGMDASFEIKLPDTAGKPSRLSFNLDYDWEKKITRLRSEIQNLDLMIFAGKFPGTELLHQQNIIMNSSLHAVLDEHFMPREANFKFSSADGMFFHPDVSDAPIPYKDMTINAGYDSATKTLTIADTHLIISDAIISAQSRLSHETETHVTGTVAVGLNKIEQSKIGALWPKALRGDNSEKWIVQRMSDGLFKNVGVSLNLSARQAADKSWNADIRDVLAKFEFENMGVDYRAPLHPVRKANGHGVFDLNKDELAITITDGFLGKVTVDKADLVFDRVVAEGEGGATMQIKLSGGVQDMLRYLAEEPIHLNKRMNMDIDKVKGTAKLDIGLAFPTQVDVKMEDFKVDVSGSIKDPVFPDVVGDLDLNGGALALTVKDGLATAKGKSRLENRDIDLEWMQYLDSEGKKFKSKVKASVTADPNLRQRLGIDLSDFIEGSVDVDVDYVSYANNTATAKLDIDATQGVFFVEPFDFRKEPGEPATASLVAKLKNAELLEINDLTASGKEFTLTKTDLQFTKRNGETALSKGKLSAFTLGESKGNLDFVFDKHGALKMVLDAEFLDVQPFMDAEEKKGEYSEPPMVISVTAKAMRTAPTETVSNAKMFIDINRQGQFNQMEMDAHAGTSDIYLRYKPDKDGKRVFRMQTDDAGAALKAFQVYNNIIGGKMVIYGEPVNHVFDRNLTGIAEITDFKVVEAPVLTKLLSILSFSGLLEVLSSDGLSFTKLEANFSWVYRKGGSLLVLKDGRTSGNSLGLTFDGTFDNAKRIVDVSGTIVPMSEINNIIGKIPLVGDILTGGSGGIFAATYSIKGSSDKPEIGVNPLSVLTPGILRRILFE